MVEAGVRTSTDDQQSPEDSRRWQLDIATRLVAPAGGAIVAVYHDIDVTRERPWSRRPEASRLLRDVAEPRRGWSALVIAEPQRAFSGGQFQLVFPQLTHYGVELWVPELSGRIDPDSEGHEMLMSLFGGLSKAERRRLQPAPATPCSPTGRRALARWTPELRLSARRHQPASPATPEGGRGDQASGPRARPGRCDRGAPHLRAVRHRRRVPVDRQHPRTRGIAQSR